MGGFSRVLVLAMLLYFSTMKFDLLHHLLLISLLSSAFLEIYLLSLVYRILILIINFVITCSFTTQIYFMVDVNFSAFLLCVHLRPYAFYSI